MREDRRVTESRGPLDGLETEVLGGSRRYTRMEVVERAGVDVEHARTLWRALGFADVDDDNVAFTSTATSSSRSPGRWGRRCRGWPSGRSRP
jgi:hypothetical protein